MMDFLYDNWPKLGIVGALFMLWPLVFNSMVPIGSILWFAWLIVPVYCLHQFEEYVFPGSFKEQMNIILTGQKGVDFPLNRKNAFFINTLCATWLLMPLSMALGIFFIWIPLVVAAATAFNALLHIGTSIRFRKYKAGLVTSVLFNLPLGTYVLVRSLMSGIIIASELAVIIAIGIIGHWLAISPLFINLRFNRKKYSSN